MPSTGGYYFRFVYGVRRFGSDSNVNPGLIDAAGYDGIKAFQSSLKNTETTGVDGGPNPAFVNRATGTSCAGSTDNCYMGDGREDKSDATETSVSIVGVQETPYTRCLICHGTQEFRSPPATASEVLPILQMSSNLSIDY